LDEAKEYANENGLTLDVSEEHSDSVEKGNIISQSPEANTEVVAGTEVEVVQSLGKKEQPPKSHNVSFTVPYEPDEKDDAHNNEASEKYVGADSQGVDIYVEDKHNDISSVFHEETITKDEEFALTLVVEPDTEAKYKAVRDGETILDKSVSY